MFPGVVEVTAFLKELLAEWCVAGGWALDLFLGRVTRSHLDVDLCVLSPNRHEYVRYL